jgi:hypothetical protein
LPTVAEIADQVKLLRAAQNIEAAPQRVRQKHSAAEEPITARIRRRAEIRPASDSAIEAATAAQAEVVSPSELPQSPSADSPTNFQNRIEIERRPTDGPENTP